MTKRRMTDEERNLILEQTIKECTGKGYKVQSSTNTTAHLQRQMLHKGVGNFLWLGFKIMILACFAMFAIAFFGPPGWVLDVIAATVLGLILAWWAFTALAVIFLPAELTNWHLSITVDDYGRVVTKRSLRAPK